MTKHRPPRFYFVDDDPAALWRRGDTGDDLGIDASGRHLLRLDGYPDVVSIMAPYERGIIARLCNEGERPDSPEGFSDAELDAYLDRTKEEDEEE